MSLLLSRRTGEAVLIGDLIEVTVVRVRRGKIRLKIEAPQSMRIDRAEVRRRGLHDHVARVLEKV